MNIRKIITGTLFAIGVMAVCSFIYTDDDVITKVISQLDKWNETNLQEKVYLQFDKPYYAAGEEIWFKAYTVIGQQHQLSAKSGVLNVELIDEQGIIRHADKLALKDGLAFGDFALPDTLKAGTYHIRAYTNYMRNASDEYFFDKELMIGNSVSNDVFTHVSYNLTNQNGQQKVTALVTYTDLDGVPYANKEVKYDLRVGTATTIKGSGITDGNGILSINFVNNTIININSGQLITTIKYANKKTNTQSLNINIPSATIDVQFFPEGGNMVANLPCKVAFKATGEDGLGVDIKGVIKDSQNNEITKLGTAHFGMGVFSFIPEPKKAYHAVYTLPNGTEKQVNLPVVAEKGITMGVLNTDSATLSVQIHVSESIATIGDRVINIVAQQNGKVYYAAKAKLNKAVYTAKIAKSRFPTGIVQFTVFSATAEPMCERLVFIQNPDLLKLSVNADKRIYTPRQKVKLDLSATGAAGTPAIGNFSVAVTDESKVPIDELAESTITSSLLLTSDLKGYIEKPNYYFANVTAQTRNDLDALMLTQGYRRFVWKQVMSDNFPAQQFEAEKGLSIAGRLTTPGGEPVGLHNVTLFTNTNGWFVLDTLTSADGWFTFNNLLFTDSIPFIVDARINNKESNIRIMMADKKGPLITHYRNNAIAEINNAMVPYLKNSKEQFEDLLKTGMATRSTLLKEVNVIEKAQQLTRSENRNGIGVANQVITAKDLAQSACVTLASCLQGKISFVRFNLRTGQVFSNRENSGNFLSAPAPMLIVLDGIPMNAPDVSNNTRTASNPPFSLDEIRPEDVESIEVLLSMANTTLYGAIGGGGVLVITTKRGPTQYDYKYVSTDVLSYNAMGFQKSREFYSPRYDDPKTNMNMADMRTTLYWAPNIYTDNNGKATIEFFTAASKGIHRVVVEGIDSHGNLGRQVYKYKVE